MINTTNYCWNRDTKSINKHVVFELRTYNGKKCGRAMRRENRSTVEILLKYQGSAGIR